MNNKAPMISRAILLIIISNLMIISPPLTKGAEEEPDRDISILVKDLSSPYFLRRSFAMKKILAMGSPARDALVEDFHSQDALGKRERLAILDRLVWDSSLNDLAWSCEESSSPNLRLMSIRYLAGHPEINKNKYIDWTHALLQTGSEVDKQAYLQGMRKPAPLFQVRAVSEALALPAPNLGVPSLKALEKGWTSHATHTLHSVITRIRAGSLPGDLLLPAMQSLGKVATEDALPSVLYGLTAPSLSLREASGKAGQRIVRHLFRARRFESLLLYYHRIHEAFPSNMEAGLDLADAMIQYSQDRIGTAEYLHSLQSRIRADRDTESRIHGMEIEMGLAMNAFWAERDGTVILERSREAGRDSGKSIPLRRALARMKLLQGALMILSGREGLPPFQEALKIAPYDPGYAEIDLLFSGRFSLANLVWRLDKAGRVEDASRIMASMTRALRTDRSGSGYYPLPEEGSHFNERVRSRIPLNEAFHLLHDAGDPAQALMKLDKFVDSIEESPLYANMDLLARASYYQGLAAQNLGQTEEAAGFIEKGIRIYDQIIEGFKEAWVDAALEESIKAFQKEKARGSLYLETLAIYHEQDQAKSERLTREALEAAPDFDEALIALVMVQDRSGNPAGARNFLIHMDAYPDRFYNMACLCSRIGDREAALAYLGRYFQEFVTPPRLHQSRQYARQDPDLEDLRQEPGFLSLVQ
jgi:tetratricopeptide (TPR) repeat protein